MQESECYITIKDHKEDFPNKLSCRLINHLSQTLEKLANKFLTKLTVISVLQQK